jgi:signal transduction histidine kinase
LLNLLTNAIKFTPKGRIEIICYGQPLNNPKELHVMVKDNGAGIPKDKLQSLFKEFSKVEDSLNLNPSGIGLGLFICKRVVEGCGGQIKVLRSVHAL